MTDCDLVQEGAAPGGDDDASMVMVDDDSMVETNMLSGQTGRRQHSFADLACLAPA